MAASALFGYFRAAQGRCTPSLHRIRSSVSYVQVRRDSGLQSCRLGSCGELFPAERDGSPASRFSLEKRLESHF